MPKSAIFWTLHIFAYVAIFAFSAETVSLRKLLNELAQIQTSQEAEPPISEYDIIALVDARLGSLDQRKALVGLEKLQGQFELASESTPNDKFLYGDAAARITFQLYADIECPFCRKMHSEIKQVVDQSQGSLNWEYKHFPLAIHNPVAAVQHQAIECIRQVYGNSTAWLALDKFVYGSQGNGRGIPDINGFVTSFGLNGALIDMCLSGDTGKQAVNHDYQEGQGLGVNATPAILIKDNQTKKEFMVLGYKTPDQMLQAVQNVLSR
jgi:protein-disulfide isomerase